MLNAFPQVQTTSATTSATGLFFVTGYFNFLMFTYGSSSVFFSYLRSFCNSSIVFWFWEIISSSSLSNSALT